HHISRLDFIPHFGNDISVYLSQSGLDELVGFASGSDSGVGNVFVETNGSVIYRCLLQTWFEWLSRIFEIWFLRARLFGGCITPFLFFFHAVLFWSEIRVRDEGICLSSFFRTLRFSKGTEKKASADSPTRRGTPVLNYFLQI